MVQLPALIKELLQLRGYSDPDRIADFLSPQLANLPHPLSMKGMAEAIELIVEAIQEETPILIWGDYDVDGTTATSLLVNFFKKLGIDVFWHIPNRITEGYGLNFEYFKKLPWKEGESFIFITVDCGISNYKEIREIQQIGGRVLVTDHHQLPTQLPECIIINPSDPRCDFASSSLAGVGVAFYLAAGIRSALIARKTKLKNKGVVPNLKSFLGFVALGTIADVVNLSPVNRILVRGGIETFSDPEFCGLQALLSSCEIVTGDVSTDDIGFNIAPTINAAGRYGVGRKVVELLTEKEPKKAAKLAGELKKLNASRKIACTESTTEILNVLDEETIKEDKCIIILGDFFEGIIGILASRLVDQFKVPVIVFTSSDNKLIKGSARSVEGVDIHKILTGCSFLLQKFGGHEMAAGMSLREENFLAFKDTFVSLLSMLQQDENGKVPAKRYDIECSIEEVFKEETLRVYKMLEPFGSGNQQPLFYDTKALVVAARQVGANKEHLQLTLRGTYQNNIKAIGFNLGTKGKDVIAGSVVKIIFTPTINRFKERSTWQARITDIL